MTRAGADVVIVGGGPAGSTAALLLARAGHDVLLLDRHHFPREKPCGDCLSAAVGTVLDRLGVAPRINSLPQARLPGWRIVAPGGSAFAARFEDGSAPAIERALLDAALLDAARDAGARLLEGVRVTDLCIDGRGAVAGVVAGTVAGTVAGGHEFRARLVIGADGLRSVVARRLGAVARAPRLRKLSLTLHVETPRTVDDFGVMHCGDGLCVGIAPVRADGTRCNVTVVADAARFGRSVARDPHAFVRRAFAAMPQLGAAALPDTSGLRILASGPFDRPTRRVTFDGAALAGDAAGYYDPFTGQGVFQALTCAELLAAVADVALRRGDCSARALAPYARNLRRALREPRLVQHGIEAVLSRPRLADRAIARIARAPAFARVIIGVTGDTLPAAALLSTHALWSLLIPSASGEPA